MAAPFLIKAVTELLADVPASDKTLLDVSCKEGDVLQALKPRGFVLRGTNFEVQGPAATGLALNGIPIVTGLMVYSGLPSTARVSMWFFLSKLLNVRRTDGSRWAGLPGAL